MDTMAHAEGIHEAGCLILGLGIVEDPQCCRKTWIVLVVGKAVEAPRHGLLDDHMTWLNWCSLLLGCDHLKRSIHFHRLNLL